MTEQSGTVHVIDDDEELLESVRFFLQAHWLSVRTYVSAEEFLAEPAPEPGCVLLDLRMPGIGGLELLQRLASECREMPVVVLTAHGNLHAAVSAMKLGAIDFLTKPYDSRQLLETVQGALARGLQDATRAARRRQLAGALDSLTERERDVLGQLVLGQSSREIAAKLGLRPKSVEIYRSRLLTKLDFSSSIELASTLLTTFPGRFGSGSDV